MTDLPAFSLSASDGRMYSKSDFDKGIFVIYVYPKDMTSGCTVEANDFNNMLPMFEEKNVKIFGLSKDSIKSHEKFCQRDELKFPLISDESTDLLNALGTWKEKSMYGRKYWGAERSTFVIKDGKIIKSWRKVKVPGHVAEVLDFVMSI